MSLLEFIIIITALVLGIRVLKLLTKRTALLIGILKLKALPETKIEITNLLAFYLPFISKKPVCRVKVRSKTYALSLFNGKGHSYAAHIVNETYATVFMKSGGAVKARLFVRKAKAVKESARVYFPKTVFLPPLSADADEIPVLIFSPVPRELTYVSRERTSIKVAFTGDDIYGWKIFTPGAFGRFIDRDSRGFYDDVQRDVYI